ncbi:MAG: hypothetical protein K8S99_11410 [Planctomycetes bacterium]|nr:hypothetical protein [Planctomycetota bacterium]
MISIIVAMRAVGVPMLLGTIFLVVLWAYCRRQIYRIRRNWRNIPDAVRQLSQNQIVSYVSAFLCIIFALFWVAVIQAVRFDWDDNDVDEIEIIQSSSPYPRPDSDRKINIFDSQTLSRVFDSLKLIQPYYSNHEHAIGKTYALRLRRRTDGQWSNYRIIIYPDRESGEVKTPGVYAVSLISDTGYLHLGNYQAIELGHIVDELAQKQK